MNCTYKSLRQIFPQNFELVQNACVLPVLFSMKLQSNCVKNIRVRMCLYIFFQLLLLLLRSRFFCPSRNCIYFFFVRKTFKVCRRKFFSTNCSRLVQCKIFQRISGLCVHCASMLFII